MTANGPKLVQFIHPGPEHGQDRPGWKDWNQQPHRRKFLRSHGHFVTDARQPVEDDADVVFWGEWEAQSSVRPLPGPRGSGLPRWLHTPRLRPLTDYSNAQNTDPFVFGEHLLYTCCKQLRSTGRPTQLRYLSAGSVILFGSHSEGSFRLDTLFVVDDHVDHSTAGWEHEIAGWVPKIYRASTLEPVYATADVTHNRLGVGWRLYRGANFARPVHGMFSFVPALSVSDEPAGFARPTIRLRGLITDNLKQGQKLTQLAPAELGEVWLNVADQVSDAGLVLATRLQLPDTEQPEDASPSSRQVKC